MSVCLDVRCAFCNVPVRPWPSFFYDGHEFCSWTCRDFFVEKGCPDDVPLCGECNHTPDECVCEDLAHLRYRLDDIDEEVADLDRERRDVEREIQELLSEIRDRQPVRKAAA